MPLYTQKTNTEMFVIQFIKARHPIVTWKSWVKILWYRIWLRIIPFIRACLLHSCRIRPDSYKYTVLTVSIKHTVTVTATWSKPVYHTTWKCISCVCSCKFSILEITDEYFHYVLEALQKQNTWRPILLFGFCSFITIALWQTSLSQCYYQVCLNVIFVGLFVSLKKSY